MRFKWHLPEWCVDFPTPVKRSFDLMEMSDEELHSVHSFAVVVLMPLAEDHVKRWDLVWDLIDAINYVLRMPSLERIARS